MDAIADAEGEETDGPATEAQRGLPKSSLPTSIPGDRTDQSDIARLGELLCFWAFEPVFLVHSLLGRKEDPAPLGESATTPGLWLEAVE